MRINFLKFWCSSGVDIWHNKLYCFRVVIKEFFELLENINEVIIVLALLFEIQMVDILNLTQKLVNLFFSQCFLLRLSVIKIESRSWGVSKSVNIRFLRRKYSMRLRAFHSYIVHTYRIIYLWAIFNGWQSEFPLIIFIANILILNKNFIHTLLLFSWSL